MSTYVALGGGAAFMADEIAGKTKRVISVPGSKEGIAWLLFTDKLTALDGGFKTSVPFLGDARTAMSVMLCWYVNKYAGVHVHLPQACPPKPRLCKVDLARGVERAYECVKTHFRTTDVLCNIMAEFPDIMATVTKSPAEESQTGEGGKPVINLFEPVEEDPMWLAIKGIKKGLPIVVGKVLDNIAAEKDPIVWGHDAQQQRERSYENAAQKQGHWVRLLEMIPFEIVIRGYAAGSYARRYEVKDGEDLGPNKVAEVFSKGDTEDYLVKPNGIEKLSSGDDVKKCIQIAKQAYDSLSRLFLDLGLQLVDVKFEFGVSGNRIFLADEITLDCMRLWDLTWPQYPKLDKDIVRERVRRDNLKGDVSPQKCQEAYKFCWNYYQLLMRLCSHPAFRRLFQQADV